MNKTIAFILAVVMVVALALIFTGCDAKSDAVADELKDPRFERIYKTNLDRDSIYGAAWVIRDRETGVEYLFVYHDRGCGLCPLYDENGNVIIGEAEGKEGTK